MGRDAIRVERPVFRATGAARGKLQEALETLQIVVPPCPKDDVEAEHRGLVRRDRVRQDAARNRVRLGQPRERVQVTAFEGKRPVPHVPGGFCTNTWRRPIAEANANIISWLEDEMVKDDILPDALEEARRRIQERVKRKHDETPEIRARVERLKVEHTKLLGLVLFGAPDKSTEAFYHCEIAASDLRGLRTRSPASTPSTSCPERRRLGDPANDGRGDEARSGDARSPLRWRCLGGSRAAWSSSSRTTSSPDPVLIQNTRGKGQDGEAVRAHGRSLRGLALGRARGHSRRGRSFPVESGVPSGIRTRVSAVKGHRPGPG